MGVTAYGSSGGGAAGLGLELLLLLLLHATDLGGWGARAGGHRARSHFLLICGTPSTFRRIIQASPLEQGSQFVRAHCVTFEPIDHLVDALELLSHARAAFSPNSRRDEDHNSSSQRKHTENGHGPGVRTVLLEADEGLDHRGRRARRA